MRYVSVLLVAAIAGTAAGLFGGSGNGARVVGASVACVVLAVGMFLIARHEDRAGVARMSRFLLWVVFVVVALPGLAWFALWMSDLDPQALYGLAAVAVAGLPVAMTRLHPRAVPLTSGFCLLVVVATLVLWRRLFLFLPASVAAAGGWLLSLALLGYARRRRTEIVVPSN
ncbi:hypothetical protein HFP15_19910 [Amycolatopsis sp. K13G38]|uniref:Uncharacterized protein n=1 Tax=Amycolatopsis acididurans TaxID=2724524 RepID=A0ABX1J5T4_9PSEU|nr:hypothetical protein [Amycolatopsis acididurans]NKQ55152.1 hypothetical protein [Amycolatopsis acididurans]